NSLVPNYSRGGFSTATVMSMTDWLNTCFIRGGTRKGLCFNAADLPADEAERDAALWLFICSPDRHGRQLNGMVGGISSLSKVMLVEASAHEGIDVDYTFGHVEVGTAHIDYPGNCGNLSSGVVPFALEAGIIDSDDGTQEFTLFNTNTSKTVKVGLEVKDGRAAISGDVDLPGVAGTGSAITLTYPHPAGSRTAVLLLTGSTSAAFEPDGALIPVSLVYSTMPVVSVSADDVGLTGIALPTAIGANKFMMSLLER